MGAKGNTYWTLRAEHGRGKKFETPDVLWDACIEYFVWIDENPLEEEKLWCHQGDVTRDKIKKIRAMSLVGLCVFLNIDRKTWSLYQEREDFIHITQRVEGIIYAQKFEGAAADLLNANIIARELGLQDSKSIAVDGPIAISALTAEEYKQARKEMLENDDC